MAKLVECVPNFSVSREKDPAVFQGLVDTANSIPGCFVFDVQSDGNHNRCVFTLLGSPRGDGRGSVPADKKRRPKPSICAGIQASTRAWARRTSFLLSRPWTRA